MNLSMVVVGAARSGKTLFCINFAEYLGARSLSYSETGRTGVGRGAISPDAARKLMVSNGRSSGGMVRTFAVHLMQRPGRRIAITDTASLKERFPLPPFERTRLLLTLQAIEGAGMILQFIDLSCRDPARLEFDESTARHLADYCRGRGKYFLVIGSKSDLLEDAYERENFAAPGNMLFISSVTRAGFPGLRSAILDRVSSRGGQLSQEVNQKGHG